MAVDQWSTSSKLNKDPYGGNDWLPSGQKVSLPPLPAASTPKASVPSSGGSPAGSAPSGGSSGGGSSILGSIGGLFGGGGMPSISPSATAGDASSSVLSPFYFSSPFAVGSGAKATADQSGAGATGGKDDLMKTALYVGAALIVAAILAKTLKS